MNDSGRHAAVSVSAVQQSRRPIVLLGLLTAIYTVAFVDRQIVNIIAEEIKNDLHLTDAQVGLLAGPAFAVSYTLAAVPLARLAERVNRVRLLGTLVAAWSALTALGGIAQGFGMLVLARVGVGACEAGCVPAAHSLISDVSQPGSRGRALAIFSTGLPLGSLLGLAVGGILAHEVGWRGALLVVGLPGLILSLLLITTCRDPRLTQGMLLGGTARNEHTNERIPTLLETLKLLLGTPSFLWMTAGASILALAGYGHGVFYASFFLRNHAAELADLAASFSMGSGLAFLGLALGLAIGISGAIGTTLGGILGDRFARTNFKAYMAVPAVATTLGMPITLIALLVPNAAMAIGLLAAASLLKSMWYGPLFASIQGLVEPRSRATAVSVFLLVMNGLGLGLGPPLLGALSDHLGTFYPPAEALRLSMVGFSLLVAGSAACFALAVRHMPARSLS